MNVKARVTKITDVARAADTSPATVSRVLNGTGGVSPELKARVLKAATSLGYVPDGSARALRRQHASVWAAIVSDIENPFFTAARSRHRGCRPASAPPARAVQLRRGSGTRSRLHRRRDRGAHGRRRIAVASGKESSVEPLIARHIPVVAIDRSAGRDVDAVVVDNRLGAEEATRHLIDHGSRRVGCITGPTRVNTANERLEGYRRAIVAAGLTVDDTLIQRATSRSPADTRPRCRC